MVGPRTYQDVTLPALCPPSCCDTRIVDRVGIAAARHVPDLVTGSLSCDWLVRVTGTPPVGAGGLAAHRTPGSAPKSCRAVVCRRSRKEMPDQGVDLTPPGMDLRTGRAHLVLVVVAAEADLRPGRAHPMGRPRPGVVVEAVQLRAHVGVGEAGERGLEPLVDGDLQRGTQGQDAPRWRAAVVVSRCPASSRSAVRSSSSTSSSGSRTAVTVRPPAAGGSSPRSRQPG